MQEKEDLKLKLLKTNCFKNNKWLDYYVDLIYNNQINLNNDLGHKTQKHHILPKSYSKYLKESINNSKENLVNLTYKDHILSHLFLFLSAANEELKIKSRSSIIVLTQGKIKDITELFDENDYKIILDDLQQIYDYDMSLIGENNPFYGCSHTEKTKKIISDKVKKWQQDNPGVSFSKIKSWREKYPLEFSKAQSKASKHQLGTHQTPERKLHISQALTNYYSTHEKVFTSETREKISKALMGHNFTKETSDKISKSVGNFICFTNGKTNIHIFEDEIDFIESLNLGYKLGQTKGLKCKTDPDNFKKIFGVYNSRVRYRFVNKSEVEIWLNNGWFKSSKEAKRSML